MPAKLSSLEAASEALKIPEGPDRAAYLDLACGDDAELRRQVESLLALHGRAGRFLEAPTLGPEERPSESPGAVIGPYKLLEEIGEGGMGAVYMAEQAQPVRRQVALKVIKPGMDTKQVIARFEAERQALAMMDHPNIARVLDAGATDSGRPYFVMELVRGIPITDYCDRERLSIPERLELFVLVCRAVQHAHQKGIIHRDLKPSNVLVTVIDGVAFPKVIDFGVAKATGQSLTERTIYTGFHSFVGTPLYMSPEQADLAGMDVDTRSDIYALGVLLYELLTGTTPFDQETFRKAAFDEVRRIVREQEPPRPSTRIGKDSSTASRFRPSSLIPRPSSLQELDCVVMKALEKDRDRRYETANSFAADLMRYLTDQPVEACPPSGWYRFSKYARRHRAGLMTAAVVSLALIAGTAVSAWQAVRATNAEQRMADALTDARSQRREANRKAAETAAVSGFLIRDLLAQASPTRSQGRELTVMEAMARAEATLDDRFADQPLIEAAIRQAVAEGYGEMGHYGKGERHARRALDLRLKHLGLDHRETLESMHFLADILHSVHKNNEAHDLCQRTLEARRRVLGPEHEDTIASRILLGHILRDLGQLEASRAMHESTYDLSRRVLGPDDAHTLEPMIGMGLVYRAQKQPSKAQTLYEAVLAVRRRAARPDPFALQWTLLNLDWVLQDQGKFAEAEAVAEEALEIGSTSLGLDHWHTGLALGDVIRCLAEQGKGEKLRALHKRWVDRLEGSDAQPGKRTAPRLTGERLGTSMSGLVWFELLLAPKLADPEACLRDARPAAELNLSSSFGRDALALAYQHAGRHDEALAAIKEGKERGNWSQFILSMALHGRGDKTRARAIYDQAGTWMDEHDPSNWSGGLLRAQAAALLGVKQPEGKVKPAGTTKTKSAPG
jgi:serine/threonine protein kinase/tetratricopeptide (TPR) repeat protein